MERRRRTGDNEATIERLKTLPQLSRWKRRDLAALAAEVTEHRCMRGDMLIEEGTPGYAFYLILDGEATVHIGGRRVAGLGRGEFFGELALLDNAPRTATVIAGDDLVVAVCAPPAFAKLMAGSPIFGRTLLAGMSGRLRNTLREVTAA